MDKFTVCLSGLLYPLAMLDYFWEAFEQREDVNLFVLGPFFDDWTPWGGQGGMRLPKKYVKHPNLALPQQTAQMHLHPQMVIDKLPKNIDLFIQCDAGWRFSARPPGKFVVHIQTDPHVLKTQYKLPKSYSDISYSMQNCYREDDESFLPYAFSPRIHYHQEMDKEYDACLIGLLYDHRAKLIQQLRQRGHKVYYNLGDIYDLYRIRYNQSKVALSWSSLLDLPCRVWEGFAMQLPVVTNRVPDLKLWFIDGEDYLGFDTLDEGIAQTEYFLEHPAFAKMIASNAYEKVKDEHTWDKRVETILKDVGLL